MVYFTICLGDTQIFLAFSEVLHFPMGFISHGNFFSTLLLWKKIPVVFFIQFQIYKPQ